MSGWQQRRFWSSVTIGDASEGYEVLLDGKPVRTPAKAPLLLPSYALAEAVATEWRAQGDVVDPGSMPVTRMANSAIDKVSARYDEVANHLAAYAETDLLCYRADHPEGLVSRQKELWDPWLNWAEATLGARLVPTAGVIPVEQDKTALAELSQRVRQFSAFELAAFHDLVGLSGSLVLGFATAERAISPDGAWDVAHVDENWQVEQWGADEEAERVNSLKRRAFLEAERFFRLAQNSG